MNTIKPAIGLLLFVGVMSLWMFQIHYSSKANDEILIEKLNSLDSKMNELESEIYFLDLNEIK